MIASLKGVVTEKFASQTIIDVAGVGYGVLTTVADQGLLNTGSTAKVYVYEHIKEDAHDLYGFCNLSGKQLFEQLLTVKNIGPKGALAVLDIGSVDSLRAAIAAGDVKLLQTAKGVGKRAAEQIVVELRDKVGAPVGEAAEQLVGRGGVNQQDEAVQALMALGYSDIDAQAALQRVDPGLSTEDRIKQALRPQQ